MKTGAYVTVMKREIFYRLCFIETRFNGFGFLFSVVSGF
jgi:hypothetical protein